MMSRSFSSSKVLAVPKPMLNCFWKASIWIVARASSAVTLTSCWMPNAPASALMPVVSDAICRLTLSAVFPTVFNFVLNLSMASVPTTPAVIWNLAS